ncbi:MAG: hypothetical protein BWY54_00006 [Candidatus Dependentiae bacterium ADurb.Bin331]|nr:MAG: hypothetical protein BWY54_00006 [Candidatus Dependentiae bacterium ADurb.Bin331]
MKKLLLSLLTLSLVPFSAFSMSNLARFKITSAIFQQNPTKLAAALQKSYNYSVQHGFDYKKLGIVETENFINLQKLFQVKKELDQLAQKTDSRFNLTKKLFDVGKLAVAGNGIHTGAQLLLGGSEFYLSGGSTIGSVLMGMGGSAIAGGAFLIKKIVTGQRGTNLAECAKIINQARDQFTNGLL